MITNNKKKVSSSERLLPGELEVSILPTSVDFSFV